MFCKVVSLRKDGGAEAEYAGRPCDFSTEGGEGLNEDGSLNRPDAILRLDREKVKPRLTCEDSLRCGRLSKAEWVRTTSD
jgi:hypothetical protein